MMTGSLLLALTLGLACGDKGTADEGTQPGDCSDGADNDADGLFDCDDDGCAGSPDCQGEDGGSSDGGADGGDTDGGGTDGGGTDGGGTDGGGTDGGGTDGGGTDGGGTDGGGTDGGGTDGGGTDGGGTDGGGTDGGGTDGGGTDGGGTDGGGTDGGASDGGSADTSCSTTTDLTVTFTDGTTLSLAGAAWEAKSTGAKVLLVDKGNPCEMAATEDFPGAFGDIEIEVDIVDGDSILFGPKEDAFGYLQTSDGSFYGYTDGSMTVDFHMIDTFMEVSDVDIELESGDGTMTGSFQACYCDHVIPDPSGGDTGAPLDGGAVGDGGSPGGGGTGGSGGGGTGGGGAG